MGKESKRGVQGFAQSMQKGAVSAVCGEAGGIMFSAGARADPGTQERADEMDDKEEFC